MNDFHRYIASYLFYRQVRIFLFIFFLIVACPNSNASQVVDSSPLFNQCIREQKTISLQKGKTYYLNSKIIAGKNISIHGNGAKIVIPKSYPLSRYDDIFSLKDSGKIYMENVNITCLLGQKFSKRDSTGDTSILSAKKGMIRLKNVNFECRTHYNNVTFIFSTGADVYMNNCKIVNDTWSKQGGILWYMSKTSSLGSITLKNCYFEHDAKDECMCFSVSGTANIQNCLINVNVDNCTYYSPCQSRSSGMIILYNHNNHVFADVHVNYKKCKFICKGPNKRSISTLQCGSDMTWHYGRFVSQFNQCEFNYSVDQPVENGILGLLPSKSKGAIDDATYGFENCSFSVHNYACMIGDKDGYRKGKYTFKDCQLSSEGRLFQKRYNLGTGKILITLDKTTCKSADMYYSTEKLYSTKSQFTNINGEDIKSYRSLNSLNHCKIVR